jgi:hypothetical protein
MGGGDFPRPIFCDFPLGALYLAAVPAGAIETNEVPAAVSVSHSCRSPRIAADRKSS